MTNDERNRLLILPVVLAAVGALAWAGGAGGATVAGWPVFAVCCLIAITIQWVAFVPAYLGGTERFYDLTGSVTYVTVTVAAFVLSGAADTRSALLAGLVVVWAVRLGTFLFARIRADGKDRRFDEIKVSAPRFLLAWTLQGVWVCFTAGAALAAIAAARPVPLDGLAWLGLAVWITGFGIEVVSDRQKRLFKEQPENEGRFIRSGLWAWSRHPNYFGEMVLWVGIALLAAPVLRGPQLATLVSPLFVTLLLTKVSGIPMLEERADSVWGGDPEYEAYKAATPVLVPRPPRS